jgi:hypothetical protein
MDVIQATDFAHNLTYAVVAPIARRAAAAALKYTIFLRSLVVKDEKYEHT